MPYNVELLPSATPPDTTVADLKPGDLAVITQVASCFYGHILIKVNDEQLGTSAALDLHQKSGRVGSYTHQVRKLTPGEIVTLTVKP